MIIYYLLDYKSPYDMLFIALTELLDLNPNAKVYIKNINMHIYSMNLKRKQNLENGRLAYTNPFITDNGKFKIKLVNLFF
jgi:hypothetical protein